MPAEARAKTSRDEAAGGEAEEGEAMKRTAPASFCPDYPKHCKGSLGRTPMQLNKIQMEKIEHEISARGLTALPDLELGESFFQCTYCSAVWKARSFRLSPSARVLGEMDGMFVGWRPR